MSSMAPTPSTVAAAAMRAVTAGVAMPSLRPLSTFSERRMDAGSDSSDTTLALSAASVGAKHGAEQGGQLPRQVGQQRRSEPGTERERERQSDGEQAGREPGVAAEVLRVDPGGVGEQEQREGDLGQSVHRVRLDRDRRPPPRVRCRGAARRRRTRSDRSHRAVRAGPTAPTTPNRRTTKAIRAPVVMSMPCRSSGRSAGPPDGSVGPTPGSSPGAGVRGGRAVAR